MPKVIWKVEVVRENDDPDTIYVCAGCLASTQDFLRVVSKKRVSKDGTCDRCG